MPVASFGVVARQMLALVVACLFGAAVHAQDVGWLYRVEVPVADQSPQARVQASRAALLVALTRLTGLAALPQSARLNQALGSPDGYYTQFGYAQGAEPGTLLLAVQFSPPALQTLIREAGLPIWPAARPTVLVWLIVDDGEEVRLVGADEPQPVVAALLARAAERGLPLRLAELVAPEALAEGAEGAEGAAEEAPAERDDQLAPVSARMLLEADLEQLKAASRDVGAELFVVTQAGFDTQADWRADLALYRPALEPIGASRPEAALPVEDAEPMSALPGAEEADPATDEPERFAVAAASPAELGRQLVDRLVGLLLERYQVLAGGSELQRVVVSGLQQAGDYAAVLRLFAAQEVIDDVSVVRVQGDSVEFALGTIADPERLQRLVTADGRLVPDPDAQFAGATPGLALRWRGP